MSIVSDALPLPEIYYQGKTKDYYIKNDRGLWITINESSVKRQLKSQGYSAECPKDKYLSPIEQALASIQLVQDVQYAGSLAGHDSGLYQVNNRRILVTDSPNLIIPVKGAWAVLESIFEGMLNDPVQDQRPFLFGWLKVAYAALRTKKWQPGQVLALAGPVRSAKSLLQALITQITGGRSAHPYQFMTGATTFNADLFVAEHLMVEDVAESTNITKRRHFGAQIKAFSVNREQHCHGKHQQPLTLTPIWRVTISLNDEAERLLVLPPVDEDIADKLMLLKVARREMPMPTETPDQQEAFWKALVNELPAFLYYLENWEIPPELRSPRFGIKHYHNPEILGALEALSPETQLLDLIDQEVFHPAAGKTDPWVGRAADLQSRLLRENSDARRSAQALLASTINCGTYLTRLVTKKPDRVSSRRIDGHTEYTISPPRRP